MKKADALRIITAKGFTKENVVGPFQYFEHPKGGARVILMTTVKGECRAFFEAPSADEFFDHCLKEYVRDMEGFWK